LLSPEESVSSRDGSAITDAAMSDTSPTSTFTLAHASAAVADDSLTAGVGSVPAGDRPATVAACSEATGNRSERPFARSGAGEPSDGAGDWSESTGDRSDTAGARAGTTGDGSVATGDGPAASVVVRIAVSALTAAASAAAVVPTSALLTGFDGTTRSGTVGAAEYGGTGSPTRSAVGSSEACRGVAVVWSGSVGSPAAVRGSTEPFVAFAITYTRVPRQAAPDRHF
jgi:hypothetical protein